MSHTADAAHCFRETEPFGAFDDETLSAFLSHVTTHRVAAGETVYAPGDPADGMLVLADGRLRRRDPLVVTFDTTEIVLDKPGTLIAKGALLLDPNDASEATRHRHLLVAEEDAAIHKLSRASFLGMLRGEKNGAAELLDYLLFTLSDELRDLNRAIQRAFGSS